MSVGMGMVRAVIPQAILRKRFSACTIGVVNGSNYEVANFGTHAYTDLVESPTAVHDGSRFDTASLTKSIPVAMLALWAESQRYLSLDDSVRGFFPGMKCDTALEPKIRDLLRYSVWLENARLEKPYDRYSSEELKDALMSANVSTTRSQFRYGNQAPMILGFILEKVLGKRLDGLSQDILFHPLGMEDTVFFPTPFHQPGGNSETYVYTEGNIPGIVHDEITRAIGIPSGASGVFSTAKDLLMPLRLLLNKGAWNGEQLIREDLVAEIGVNQFPTGTMFGLGFGIWSQFCLGLEDMPESIRDHVAKITEGGFFKLGYTGTMVAVFPKIDTAIVILTNTVHPKRPGSSLKINELRYILVMLLLTGEFPERAANWWQKAS